MQSKILTKHKDIPADNNEMLSRLTDNYNTKSKTSSIVYLSLKNKTKEKKTNWFD